MSEENVEIVRKSIEVFNRDGLDASLEYSADDIEHRPVEGAIDDRGPMRGKEAVRAYIQDWLDTFDDFKTEAVELIAVGDDQVVAVVRLSGRAKASGIETDLTFAVLYTVRDGKLARGREYETREGALEAAGLSE
jgi:ketosteroid isomerase-like protein